MRERVGQPPAGLTIVLRDEFTVACGRVDSLYNRLPPSCSENWVSVVWNVPLTWLKMLPC